MNGLICTVVEHISMCIKLRTEGVKEEFEFYLWQQTGAEGSYYTIHRAYAVVVHPTQGQTLGKIWVVFDGNKQFQKGLSYTALSRVLYGNLICIIG